MIMNPFEQSKQQLLHALTSQVEQEVIDYIRQEMQHDAPDSIPTEEELFAFFQSPDEPTKLDAYQQILATDRLLEYAEISLRTLCDLIRYQQLKELGIVHSAKEFRAAGQIPLHPPDPPWHRGHGNNPPPTDSRDHREYRSRMPADRGPAERRLPSARPAHNPMPSG